MSIRCVKDWILSNRLLFAGFLVFELLWVAWMFLGTPGLWSSYDYIYYHVHTLDFLKSAYLDFRIPYWNPHIALGMPFAAYVEPAVFYPVNWLLVLMPVSLFVGTTLALHGALGYFSMCALARRLGAGRGQQLIAPFLFFFSTPVLWRVQLGHINFINTLCYLPLVIVCALYCYEKLTPKRFLVLCLVFFLQILCGHLQIVWMGCFALGAIVTGYCFKDFRAKAFRKWFSTAGASVLALVLALVLSAFIVLPLLEMSQESTRNYIETSLKEGTLKPTSLRTLFPMGDKDPLFSYIDPEFFGYGGVWCCVLGFAGLTMVRVPQIRGLLLLVVLSITLGYTYISPGFDLWKIFIPGYDSFRLHVRFLILVVFSLSLASSLFATFVLSNLKSDSIRLITGLLLLIIMELLLLRTIPGYHPSGIKPAFFCLLSVIIVWAGLIVWGSCSRKLRGVMIAVVVIFQCIDFTYYYKGSPKSESSFRLQNAERIKGVLASYGRERSSEKVPLRVAIPNTVVHANTAMTGNYTTPYYYTPMTMVRLHYMMSRYLGFRDVRDQGVMVDERIQNSDPFLHPGMSIDLAYDSKTNQFLRNRNKNPHFALSTTWIPAAERDWDEIIAALQKYPDGFFVSKELQAPEKQTNSAAKLKLIDYSPEAISFQAECNQDAILVMSELYFPGWKVRIDEKGAEGTFPVNIWMRGALIPAGKHDVHVYYDPEIFRLGLGISLIGVVFCCFLFWKGRGIEFASARGGI